MSRTWKKRDRSPWRHTRPKLRPVQGNAPQKPVRRMPHAKQLCQQGGKP